jgi:uncharacterized protein (UPF0297 family)
MSTIQALHPTVLQDFVKGKVASNEDNFFTDVYSGLNERGNSPVVVYFPSGNYNQPAELGRYKNEYIARTIVHTLNLPEYHVFSLETGEELFVH